MSEHKPMTKFTDECVCGNVWPCPTDLERQLAEAQDRGKFLWRTSGEWLGSWHATRRILLSHVEALTEAQGKLDRIETEMCTCNRGLVGMCIAHDKNSLLARTLKGE